MITRARSSTLIAFLFLGMSILLHTPAFLNTFSFITSANEARLEGKRTSVDSDLVARATTGSHASPATVVEPDEVKLASSIASFHFEPLMLLLLGSALFSVGATIKLVISRRLDNKPVQR